MREIRQLAVVVATATLAACNLFVGEYEAGLIEDRSVSSAHLCDVERERFAFELDLASDEAFPDLADYYDAANPQLIEHLEAVAQAYRNSEPGAGITYVMGTAGVGKSFAARNVIGGFEDTEKCEVKLSDLFYEDAGLLGFPIAPKPDLSTTDGKVVFNELPSFVERADFDLGKLLTAAGCDAQGTLVPLIVIDDLDEVHDETSAALLEDLDELVLAGADGAGPFLHVVVFGRPEGFYAWLADPARTEESNTVVDLFHLQPPRYRTSGDLAFRVRGYLDFTQQLDALEASGQLDGYIANVTGAVDAHPFLTYSMGILSVGNVVIEHTGPGLDESEQQLKVRLFDDIVLRASDTHGRPEPGGELGGPYLRALEDVAVRYAEVGDDGLFSVRSEDTVTLRDDSGSELGEVQVRDLLNRAGLALHSSATASTARYRFDPFWVHAHLIERYNLRVDEGYTYRTCE